MISMYPIGSAGEAASYHDKAFTQDGVSHADNYYVGEQAKAVWKGQGAEILGLNGSAVTRQDFISLLEGKLKNPATGETQDLTKNSRGDSRRLGYDFTVAPPKSVSVVGLVGGDERIVEAHLAANERAMEWLEKNASVVRVYDEDGKQTAKQAGNLLYATVLHETNRNNEPQIHSHNVIVSAVYDEESKKWRSLTNDQLLILRQGADQVYKAELGLGLQRAGYKLEYDKNGTDFEIAGLSREQIEAYSTRTAEIKQLLKERGINGEDADVHQRQIATIDSRAAKNEQPREVLHSIWLDVAATARLDVQNIVSDARSNTKNPELLNQLDDNTLKQKAISSVAWAVSHLSEREQSFTRPEIEVAALKFGKNGIDQVEWAVNEQLKNGALIDRGTSPAGAEMFTTNKAVAIEKEFITNVQNGIGNGRAVLTDDKEFKDALQTFETRKTKETGETYKLSDEQVISARNVLMHGDVYQGIQGDAGTGKTAALEMVKEVAEAKGWNVMGIATTSGAAKELSSSSGIQSQTVAGFISDRKNALQLSQMELAELRLNLSLHEKSSHADIPRVESHKLIIKSEGLDRGITKYTFDNERGDVFRSPGNLRNQVGSFLLDLANKQKESPSSSTRMRESLADRLRERVEVNGSGLAEALGKKLTTYEKVGTAESIAARTALSIKQDGELADIKFKIGAKQAEIANIQNTGNKEGKKTLLVMDESSMTGVQDAVKISRLANEINARVVFQGDIKQHGSVPAGKAFGQALDAGMNKSVLTETRRFDKATEPTKLAAALMARGQMAAAIEKLDRLEVENSVLPAAVADRYLTNLDDLQTKGIKSPKIGVVAVTNKDRKEINQAIHQALANKGLVMGRLMVKEHFDDPKLTEAEKLSVNHLNAAGVDKLVFRKTYREISVKKNEVVDIKSFDVNKNLLTIINAEGKEIRMNPKRQDYFTPVKIESREYGVGDKIEARANIHFENKKEARIDNGAKGVISAIDDKGATIEWSGASGGAKGSNRIVRLNNDQLRMVDFSYARTTFKEQGATNDREIIAISKTGAKVFNKEAAYVAGTRAKGNSEIVTSDYNEMLKNSGKEVGKTTAIDVEKVKTNAQEPTKAAVKDITKTKENDKNLQRARTNQNLGFTLE